MTEKTKVRLTIFFVLVLAFVPSYLFLVTFPALLSEYATAGVIIGFGSYTVFALFFAYICYAGFQTVSKQEMKPAILLAFLIPIAMYVYEINAPATASLQIFDRVYEVKEKKEQIRKLGESRVTNDRSTTATGEELEKVIPDGFYVTRARVDLDKPNLDYLLMLKPSFFTGGDQYLSCYDNTSRTISPPVAVMDIWDQAVRDGKVPDVRISRNFAGFDVADHTLEYFGISKPFTDYTFHLQFVNQKFEVTNVEQKSY